MTGIDVSLTIAVTGLAIMVLFVLAECRKVRSDLDSRLEMVENVKGPFVKHLLTAVPAPLNRVVQLGLHLDEAFWRQTLRCSADEMAVIRRSVPLHSDLPRSGEREFEKWFYPDIHISIQEWHGKYTCVEVHGPFNDRKSIHLYPGQNRDIDIWKLLLPPSAHDATGSILEVFFDGYSVKLSAMAGRFGSASPAELEPTPENVFLDISLQEGGLSAYYKPDHKVETYPDVYCDVEPWERCYQQVDNVNGLAWQLAVRDIALFCRCEGNSSQADRWLANGEYPTHEAARQAAASRLTKFAQSLDDWVEKHD